MSFQKAAFLYFALRNEATNLEIFKFFIEELKCPLQLSILHYRKKFNKEIMSYLRKARATQMKDNEFDWGDL